MKIRMVTSLAGPRFAYYPGEVVDLPDEQAKKWIDKGVCIDASKSKPQPLKAETRPAQRADDKEALRDAYEAKYGKKAPGRMSVDSLKKAVNEA